MCDVCGEDEKLAYCDTCSVSYHVQCHYPAIDLKDISTEEQVCRVCFAREKEIWNEEKENKEEISALELLAVAASVIKSKDLESSELPVMSSESDRVKHEADETVEKSYTLDNNSASLPARSCSQCGRTCRKVPLIACDYCPLYFHQDCLDPPLTTFPIGKWMCPNHPDHLIKQNLATSCQVTERMKLWDEYVNQPLDQCAIKLDFTRKTRTVNPSFRTKLITKGRPRVKVPSCIKFYYKNPVRVSPSNCSQSNLTWSVNATVNEGNQHIDFEEINNIEKNSVKETEKTNEIKWEREECDKTINEEENKQIILDKCDTRIMPGDTQCTNFESHIRCDYDITKDIKLLERPVLEVLALQRLKQILNAESYKENNCHNRVRAALFSLNPKPNPPSFMTCGNYVIGNAPNCDLVLTNYGNCGFTSSKHAVIFFDQVSSCFELLNYSEYGTVVDNVLYSCDYIPEQTKEERLEKGARTTKEDETSEIIKMILHKENVEGWEGSAVIAHGSIISFGCIMFVFNVLNMHVDTQSQMF
ncbi:PHD finger protein 12-like isoform X2 [Pseudomyrmex gracilis]|uniref:PHD finger protein 12-like isoform X2 n=1 Tax=Pseudomyrmex gracilis TaxID=219809 RepID=UPI000995890F|nr:PHD finger protein 12-like isoform X2 [Pseudomyrmex gracilis]